MTNLGKPRASGIDGANSQALEEVNASAGPWADTWRSADRGVARAAKLGSKSLTYSPTAPTNFSNCCLFVGQE